ncbi:MAG: signal peptidase I [Methanobrevibacter sp.]|jgi:signal peptidase|nr:signal peptidase I [Candidatus Methanovirga aequatorialis]
MDLKKREIVIYAVIIIFGLLAAEHLNVVISGSMEPVLYRGDIVGIEKTDFLGLHEFDPNDVKVGDIVVYNGKWFPGPIIHRVISINETNGEKTFTIKGDNKFTNPVPDPYPVKPEQIVARVITIENHPFIIPKIGYITIYIKGFFYQLLGINEDYRL